VVAKFLVTPKQIDQLFGSCLRSLSMSIQPPSISFRRSLSTKTIRLKGKPARLLVLVALMTLAATALAATVSSSSLRQFIFGAAVSGSGSPVAQSKAALTDPLLTLSATALTSGSSTMTVERRGHTATRLPDGRVLIAGGENSSGVLNQCEIYDPATSNFTTAGNMSAARAGHSATLLSNGRVLIAGGRDAVGAVKTTEIFDPATGAFTGGAVMSVARAGHSATLFADGTVLIAGGDADGSAEIFDPSSGFSSVGAGMSVARSMHSSALLQDGRVLIVGGQDATNSALSSGEIFDPADSSFADAGSMTDARVRPLLRVLFDGKVQIIGGNDHRSIEIYDPANSEFGAHAHVPPDGDLHANLINELMSSSTRAALLTGGQTITELTGSNQALAAGGVDGSGNATSASTIYASSGASVTTEKIDYPPGTPVLITGRGFQPNEIVDLTFHEDPHVDTNELHMFTVQADANGNFTFNQYSPEVADVGITYILGAKGETSGWTAQTTFTDGSVKFTAAPAGVTLGVTAPGCVVGGKCVIKTTYQGTTANPNITCTGTADPSTREAVTAGTFENDGVANKDGLSLEAPTTSDQGGAFINWTTSNGAAFTFPVLGNTRIICAPASSVAGREYVANYTGANTDVTVTKTADATPISAGSTAGYTITAVNSASGVAATSVTITDTLPGTGITWTESPDNPNCTITGGNSLSCTFASLASGASQAVHVIGTTTSANCGTLNNTATVAATNDSNTANNTASASIVVQCPDVRVQKVANPVGPVSAGDLIGFDVTLSNIGTGNAAGVSFTDSLPSGLTWTINPASPGWSIVSGALVYTPTTLAAGFSTTVHVQATTSSANCGLVSNTASATANNEGTGTITNNNSANASVTVQCPDVRVQKVANPVGPVSAGDLIGFDVTLSNIGTGSATGVTFTDTLPSGLTWTINPASAGWSIVSGALVYTPTTLAAGASTTVHVQATTSSANCGLVSNTASASANNEASTALANNSSGPINITVNCPDVKVTKVANLVGPVSAGDTIGFDVTLSNIGTGNAAGVSFTDTLPSGLTWTINPASPGWSIVSGALVYTPTTLAAGASTTVHVQATTSSANCGLVSNTASASATNEAAGATGNNSATASVTVQCPDVRVQKAASPVGPVSAGDDIGFDVTLSNIGTGNAAGVSFTDTLPAGLTWTINPASAGWSISAGTLVYTPTTLAAGASTTVHVQATTSSTNCGPVSNTASATATNEKASDNGNNSATASVTVNCPDVKVTKVASPVGPVSAGDDIGFDVTLSNIGTGNAAGVSFTDTLPTGLTWTINPASAGWSIVSGALVYTPTTLAAGFSTTVHITATTSAANCGPVSNTASASATNEKASDNGNNSATASVTVNCPDVKVTKVANPVGPVSAGEDIGFDVTLSNIGAGNAAGVSFTDTLPAGLTWTITPASAGWSIVSGALVYTPTTLAAGFSTTVHVQATTSSANCGPVSNTASATATNEKSTDTANNSATASVTVNCPDIKVTKVANPVGPVSAGDDIGFDVTLSNIGAGNAAGVSFTDTLPTGLTWTITPASAGWSIVSGALVYTPTTLAAGASTTVHVQATTSSANCGTVANTASASATNEASTTLTNNSATASVTVNCPDVKVTKVASPVGPVSAGDDIGFDVTLSNIGTGNAAGVSFTDTLPAGLTWTINPASAGWSIVSGALVYTPTTLAASFSTTVHITATTSATNCGPVSNTASASATNEASTTLTNNSATASVTVNCPDVKVTKVASPAGPVSAGDEIGFDVKLSNIGTGNAAGVTFTDALPTGLTWTIDPASAGWSIVSGNLVYTPTTLAASFNTTVHVKATTSSANCGLVSNTASASATNEASTTLTNNSATASVTVNCPDVEVLKTANPAGPVSAGDEIGFDVKLSNIGTGNAAGVTFTDALPTGLTWTIDPASAGWSIVSGNLVYTPTTLAASFNTTVHVKATTSSANCGLVSNTASASATNEASTTLTNNSATASVTVNCPDVEVLKTANPAGPVSAGDEIGFDVKLSNIGTGNAAGVTFTDALPTGLTWTIDPASAGWSIVSGNLVYTPTTLAAGFNTTVHVKATTSSANCGLVANTASASATNEAAGTLANNSAGPVNITVNCPDLSVTKTADAATVNAGDAIGYTVTLSNIGAGTAYGVSFTDTLPSGLTFTESPDATDWSISGGNLVYTPTTIAAGGTSTVHITATTSSANCGLVANTASASATNEAAGTLANNSAGPVNITVNCPDLSVTKTADAATVNAGDAIGYTVTLSNIGAGTAYGVTFTDTLPGGLTFTESPDATDWSISGGNLVYTPTTIAAGGTSTVHITATTSSANCGTVANTASASATNEAAGTLANNSAGPVNITVNCPDLSVTKTADAATVNAGDAIGYTVTLSNIGAGTAYGVSFTDTLPSGLTFTESPDATDWSISGGNLVYTPTTIAAGGTSTVHITATTSSANCGLVANTASASATNEAAGTLANNSAGPVNITVNCPDLSVTKTADAATVNAGDAIGYTVTLSNIGAGTAYGVSFTDTLPSGLTFTESPDATDWSISGGNLVYTPTTIAAGGTSTVHITATTSSANCGTVANTASASATNEAAGTLANNSAGPVNITVNCPDLSVTKTADAATVNAGDAIGYTVTLSNIGAGTAYGVSFTDTLPSGLTFVESPDAADWSISGGSLVYTPTTIVAGGTSTVHITATTSSANCGTVANTASASATNEAAGTLANNSAGPVNITVNCPDLAVTKTADAATVNAGDAIGYTVTLSNIGAGTAYGVSFTDTLPSGLTFTESPDATDWSISGGSLVYTPTTIAAGGTSTVHITATTSSANCGTVANTASASATNEAAGTLANNSSGPINITVNCPDLAVTKTADAATVNAGDAIGYTVTLSNIGAGTAYGVTFTDTLPGGLTFVESPDAADWSISGGSLVYTPTTIAAGGTSTVHITATTSSANCGTVANTASASATNEAAGTLANNSSGPINITVNCPDLSVTKTADAATVNAGDAIGYTVTLSNIGAGTAYGVSFTDTLPSGLTFVESPDAADWSISAGTLVYTPTTIAAGGTSTVHITATTSSANCGTVANTASASATNEAAGTLANNSAGPVNITVNCPDLSVTKTADAATVNAGDAIGYTVTLSNIGAGTAYGVTFTDTLPSGLTFVESPDAADWSISGGSLVYTPTTIAAGGTSTVHITATTSSANCGTVANTASASATNEAAGTLANNSAGPVNITVNCPDLSVTKTADAATVNAGDAIGYTVTLSNIGAGTAYGVSFTDTLPSGLTFTESPDATDWSISGGSLVYTPTTIAAGGTSTVHITATTSSTNCGTVANTASASATNEAAGTLANNSAGPINITVNCPDLAVTKTADAATVNAGDAIGYTVTLSNIGAGTAYGVSFTDTLPAGLTFVESPDAADWSISGGSLVYTPTTIAASGTSTVHITATTSSTNCGTVANSASASATNEASTTLGNNTAGPVNITVNCPDLKVEKTADAATVNAGDGIGYTVTLSNIGAGTAYGVTFTDALPSGLTFVESPDAADWSISGGSLVYTPTTIAAGGTSTVHITATTSATNCGTVANTASASATNEAAGTLGNNTAGPVNITVNCPDLKVEKTADAATVNAGDGIGYTVTLSNIGAGTAYGVTFTDALPSGLTFVESPDATDWSISGGALIYAPTSLAAAGSSSVHITATTSSANCGTVSNTASASATNEAAGTLANNTAGPVNITVNCPDLKVEKTADAATVNAGDAIGYTVTLSNIGAGTAYGVTFTDSLPAGLTFSESPDSPDWSISGGSLVYTPTTIAAGGTSTVHITATTSATNCGTVANTASASATNEAATTLGNNTAGPVNITVNCPDLSVTKTADAATVNAGDAIGYTVTLSNIGAGTAYGVTFTDTLPSGLTFVESPDAADWSISGGSLVYTPTTIAAGGTSTVHITATTSATNCGTVANTASASATNEAAGTLANNSAGPVNITVNCPDLSVTKTADAATVNAGDAIGYTVTLSNIGAGTAYGVSFTDTLPSGLTFVESPDAADWSISGGSLVYTPTTIAAGGTSTVHITATTSSANCGTVANTASASATNEAAGTLGNNSSGPINITVNCPDLSVTKTADAATVNAGDAIGYTVTLSNIGAGTAYGVSFTDTLPSGLTFTESPDATDWSISGGSLVYTPTTIAAGGTSTVHVVATTSSANCGTVSNTASASATNEASGTLANNSATASVIVNCPDLQVVKVANPAGPVSAGDQIGFDVTLSNIGAGTAYGVSFTDTLPGSLSWTIDPASSGWSIVSGNLVYTPTTLAAGVSTSVHVKATTSSANCGSVSNTASASAGNEASTTLANNSATASVTVQCPDVSVVKTADVSPISAGDTAAYTMVVKNEGLGVARGVTLTDTLPAGVSWTTGTVGCTITGGNALSCTFGDLNAGDTRTVNVSGTTDAADCGSLNNTANAAATNEASTTLANNSSSASITVQCPDVKVTKSANPLGPVSAGDDIGFDVTLSNTGAGNATGVSFTDTLPTGLTWTIDPASAGWSIVSGNLVYTPTTLAAGFSTTVHVKATTSATNCGTVSNTASASATNEGTGTITNNNSATATVTVNCPDVRVQKAASPVGPVSAGDDIGFDVTLSNIGAGNATGVSFTDTLPTGLTWTITPASAGWSISGSSLVYTPTTLAAGFSTTVHVKATTSSANCGPVSNTASASATNEAAGTNANNTATASVTVNCPDLTVSKTPDSASVSSTDNIGFTITVHNGGAGTATSVMLTDTLPANAGLSWAESPDSPYCSISSGVLTCNFGTMAAGADKTVHISSPTTPATCGTVSNTASASASNEALTTNNSGSGSIAVKCPDVAVTKVADATPVSGGSPIGFKITVSNPGAGTAKSVTLTDTLPTNPGLNWAIDPNPLYTDPGCMISSGVLSCSYTTLASGGSKKVHITSPTTTATCGPVMNTASASATNEATSANGNNSGSATITMNDVTAPVINLNPNAVTTLWSPNHKYVTFKVTDLISSVTDNCNTTISLSSVRITKVTSDELENINSGDGNTLLDMVIANDCKSVDLRAERDGSRNGRVYTITFSVKDAAGNMGTTTAKVTVPHSQGPKGTAIDDGPVYTVYNSNCP
jgi:uncharacterized repeat protein (TIGR01451 family)